MAKMVARFTRSMIILALSAIAAIASPAGAMAADPPETPHREATRVAVLNFGAPGEWNGQIGDTVGIQVAAQAWADVVPMLERDQVDVVVVRINSGGGVPAEVARFYDVFQQEYKPRFRTVAWVESAIGAAAMSVWSLEEFYMMPQGDIGACTGAFMEQLNDLFVGQQLEDMLRLMEQMSDAAGREPKIMRSMQIMEPLSCDIDPVTEEVIWYQSEIGHHLVNPVGRILMFNATDATKYKFSRGTAATKEELARALGLGVVEWVGQKASDYINDNMHAADRADKRVGLACLRFAEMVNHAAATQDRDERSILIAQSRRLLSELQRHVEVNPNFRIVYPLHDNWFKEQEKRLGDLSPENDGGEQQGQPLSEPQGPSDRIIFLDGRDVSCEVLDFGPDHVRVMVSAHGMSAEATYSRSRIAHLRIDGVWLGEPPQNALQAKPGDPADWDDGQTVVYTIPLTGDVRTCCTVTPVRRLLDEALEHRADVLLITLDMDDERGLVRTIEEAAPMYDEFRDVDDVGQFWLGERLQKDERWAAKPRIIFYVRRARGASAFLPLVSNDVWFAPDAVLGSSAPLNLMLKPGHQRALRIGRAEAMARRGGHDRGIVRAMALSGRSATFSIVDGKPVFYDSLDGDFLLTDDGQGERRDTPEDIAAGRVNDLLWMDAELAYALKFSRGTAVDVEEVLERAGIEQPVQLVDGAGIISRWREEVTEATRAIAALLAEFQAIQVQGDFSARKAARADQMRVLQEMKPLLDRYAEAIRQSELQNVPDNWTMDVELLIQRIQDEQAADSLE